MDNEKIIKDRFKTKKEIVKRKLKLDSEIKRLSALKKDLISNRRKYREIIKTEAIQQYKEEKNADVKRKNDLEEKIINLKLEHKQLKDELLILKKEFKIKEEEVKNEIIGHKNALKNNIDIAKEKAKEEKKLLDESIAELKKINVQRNENFNQKLELRKLWIDKMKIQFEEKALNQKKLLDLELKKIKDINRKNKEEISLIKEERIKKIKSVNQEIKDKIALEKIKYKNDVLKIKGKSKIRDEQEESKIIKSHKELAIIKSKNKIDENKALNAEKLAALKSKVKKDSKTRFASSLIIKSDLDEETSGYLDSIQKNDFLEEAKQYETSIVELSSKKALKYFNKINRTNYSADYSKMKLSDNEKKLLEQLESKIKENKIVPITRFFKYVSFLSNKNIDDEKGLSYIVSILFSLYKGKSLSLFDGYFYHVKEKGLNKIKFSKKMVKTKNKIISLPKGKFKTEFEKLIKFNLKSGSWIQISNNLFLVEDQHEIQVIASAGYLR